MTATPHPGASTGAFNVFVARQPIFDGGGTVSGYELLYRGDASHERAIHDSTEVMAAEVLVHTFLNIGLDRVTGEARAWVNFTREMLVRRTWELLDPGRVVVEILESVAPDEEVIDVVREMVARGYTIALDDYEHSPEYRLLLDLVSIVKVDVLNRPYGQIDEIGRMLGGSRLTLLAERVETHEVEQRCRAAGFTLYQGYYFQRPEILSRRELAAGQITILQLMNLLRDADSTDAQLESAFRGDVALTMKLLRTVNSASMGGLGIESIRHAVRLVGRAELHKWLALLLVTSVAARGGTDVELVRVALSRARLAELIGLQRGDRRGAEALFMVGLFSLLDALLRVPLAEVIERIDLADAIKRALTLRAGPYASVLVLIEAWERGSWDVVSAEASALRVDTASLGEMFVSSVEWARTRLGESN